MQQKNSESFVQDSVFYTNSITEALSLTVLERLFQSKLPRNCTEFTS